MIVIHLSATGWDLLALLLSTVLPVLVGLVTTRETHPGRKALLLAALAAATGLLSELAAAHTAGTAYDVGAGAVRALEAFALAVVLHFGLWKPTGVAGAAQDTLLPGQSAPVPRS